MRQKDLFFVRHAPSIPSGFLYGRTDADIAAISPEKNSWIRSCLNQCSAIISSPARRCVNSYQMFYPDQPPPRIMASLWEQSFGEWEGMAYDQLPDIGEKSGADLVNFCPTKGESFTDLCQRVNKALSTILAEEEAEKIAIFAHAGVIRASLALALENPVAGLKFEIGHLSVTHIRALLEPAKPTQFSIVCVNAGR